MRHRIGSEAEQLAQLFDFYGGLLTEKQRLFFERYYFDDLSLTEIANNEGISKQGVRNFLIRSESLLREFEEKTGIHQWQTEILDAVEAALNDIVLLQGILGLDDGEAARLAASAAEKLNKIIGG